MDEYGKSLLLVSPRGFCAGVERAVKIVYLAIQKFGKPIYIKHEIVHNSHVVDEFVKKGVIFVNRLHEIPHGKIAIFSAHGSSRKDYKEAKARKIKVIDATCPLVTKVHIEARLYANRGYYIIYIGHKGHPEPIGVLSNVPKKQQKLIEKKEEAERLILNTEKAVILTQTTLSFDDTKKILAILKNRFPYLIMPPAFDVCYATQNRQQAVKKLASQVDLVLVIGSQNSSNSNRLAEVAARKAPSFLINDEKYIKDQWLSGISKIGITSGASAPEKIVFRVVRALKEKGFKKIQFLDVIKENTVFPLPNI